MRSTPALAVGFSASPRRIGPVTATDIVRFAGAGGDFNPLHHDPAVARAAGFESIIAMGQFSAGVLAGYLTDWVGIENLRSFEVRFVAPVRAGDLLELSATVTELGDGTATVELAATVDGATVVTGIARVANDSAESL
jgi:3-hydroxybutyryl-CoA dehydratase